MKEVIGGIFVFGCVIMIAGAFLLAAGVIVYLDSHPPPVEEMKAFVNANPFQSGVIGLVVGSLLAIGAIGLASRREDIDL